MLLLFVSGRYVNQSNEPYLSPALPTGHLPTLIVHTPEQLLLRVLDHCSIRTARTALETIESSLFELLGLFQTVIEGERFDREKTSEFGFREDRDTAGGVHAEDRLNGVSGTKWAVEVTNS